MNPYSFVNNELGFFGWQLPSLTSHTGESLHAFACFKVEQSNRGAELVVCWGLGFDCKKMVRYDGVVIGWKSKHHVEILTLGLLEGIPDGIVEGDSEGLAVGGPVGLDEGLKLGAVELVGPSLGVNVGDTLGGSDGRIGGRTVQEKSFSSLMLSSS